MKKSMFVIAAALAIAASAAHAGSTSVGVEYTRLSGSQTTADSNAFAVVPAYAMGPVTLDAKLEHVRPIGGGDSFNTAEVRAKFTQPVTDNLSVSVRGGYGAAFNNGDRTEFYTVEPGASYSVAPGHINAIASYRFSDAINGTGMQTRTAFVGAELIGDETTTVVIKGFKETGDTDGKGVNLAIVRKF